MTGLHDATASTTLEAARAYLSRGFSIIPLIPGAKKPLIEWKEYQGRVPRPEELAAWLQDGGANIGAVCGAVSGGLVALDFEDQQFFQQFFNTEILKNTLVVKTPHGGIHVWLRETGEIPRRTIRISKAPALDLLGEGGFGVLPPSKIDHAKCDKAKCKSDGWSAYEIVSSTEAVMPTKGVYEFIMQRCKQLGCKVTETKARVEELLSGVPEGMRNAAAFQYARYLLFTVQLEPEAVLLELRRWNALNSPPLPEDELATVWRSAQQYPFIKTTKRARTPRDQDKYFDGDRFIPKILADEIMSEIHFATLMDTQEIYAYQDGVYEPVGEVLIKRECRSRLEGEHTKNRASETIEYIRASTFLQRREEPTNLIPLENGVLDINTMTLSPASPDQLFFTKLPVRYDPNATCPAIDTFHQQITGRPEDVMILEELAGFCLYRDYLVAKALMLIGDGSNGKSTWLALIKALLGVKNVSGRGLLDLELHRFAKADLYTKLANIYADLPDQALERTGMFKMLTGRDLITGEKKFAHSFQFVNYAKLLFSANKLPEAYDDTSAFFRRWILITFPNEFDENTADPNILAKLTTPTELSGLLNKALTSLKRLLERHRFTYSRTTEEIEEEYKRKSSPLEAFIMDCLEPDPDAFIPKKDLYGEFAEYCRRLGLPASAQDTFYKKLPKHLRVVDFRPRLGKEHPPCFKGIRYKVGSAQGGQPAQGFFYTLMSLAPSRATHQWSRVGDSEYVRVTIKVPQTLERLERVEQPDSQDMLVRCRGAIRDTADGEGDFTYEDAARRGMESYALSQDQFNTALAWLRDHGEVSKVGETRYYWLGSASSTTLRPHQTRSEEAGVDH